MPTPERQRTIAGMTREFTDRWFPAGDAFDPTEKPWVSIHDGGHVYANTRPFPLGDDVQRNKLARGERQQWFFDAEGTRAIGNRYGALGFVNSFGSQDVPTPQQYGEIINRIKQEDWSRSDAVKNETILNKWDKYKAERGLKVSDDPAFAPLASNDWHMELDERNSSGNLYDPPIGNQELRELRNRGKEYYLQAGEESRRLFGEPGLEDLKKSQSMQGIGFNTRFRANPAAMNIHNNPNLINIRGGYDTPGALPYGSMMQFVEKPKHPAIDKGLYLRLAGEKVLKELEINEKDWKAPVQGGSNVNSPAMNRGAFAGYQAKNKALEFGQLMNDKYGAPDMAGAFLDVNDPVKAAGVYRNTDLRLWQQQAGIGERDSILRLPKSPEASEIGATLREVDRVRGAVGMGARAGGAIARNLPFLDPEFHEAVDRRDGAAAARSLAKNVVIGSGMEVASAAGAGVLQRTAPGVAARVLPAAVVAGNVGNAVGLATLPAGSTPQPRGVGTYQGATVWHRPQDDSYVAEVGGKPVRLGRAKLGGKDVFVPWGSAAGTAVGPKIVGQPWWDRSGRPSAAQRVTSELVPTPSPVPARTPSGVATLTQTRPSRVGDRGAGGKVYAGEGYGWQSAASFEKLKREGRLPGSRGEQLLRRVPGLGLLNPGRVQQARRAWNPARGEFGVSEILFGK